MSLPAALAGPLAAALASLGDRSAIRSARPASGGCINHAVRLETEQRVYCLKWNADVLPQMFACEARGLAALAATHTVRVPEVYCVQERQEDGPAFLLLEWLEGSGGSPEQLGEQLAALHLAPPPEDKPRYGLDHANYIGPTPQYNDWEADWPAFYARSRLLPQMELARRTGHLPPERGRRLERLIQRLPDLLDGPHRPSLIHGDLWSGNVIAAPGGLALIDPAISYSDREAELAYTQMFGSFDPRFYAGYQHVWPLDHGYTQRVGLHNLYHLLNHLNIFGDTYGPHVDAVLRRYCGDA